VRAFFFSFSFCFLFRANWHCIALGGVGLFVSFCFFLALACLSLGFFSSFFSSFFFPFCFLEL